MPFQSVIADLNRTSTGAIAITTGTMSQGRGCCLREPRISAIYGPAGFVLPCVLAFFYTVLWNATHSVGLCILLHANPGPLHLHAATGRLCARA